MRRQSRGRPYKYSPTTLTGFPPPRCWNATTAHRARLRQRAGLEVSRRSLARAPQPPGARVPPVVEEGALRPSRNPVTRCWNATTAHRARLRQRAGLEVSRRSLARAPQPPGGRVPPVVEEGALRPSRNQVTRCWNATTAHRARLRQRAGLEVSRRSLARAPQPPGGRVPPVVEEGALRPSRNQVTRCWNATTAHRARPRQRAGLEVSRRSLARAPQPPGGRVPPVVEEGALRPSRNQVTRCWNATTAHRARLRQRAGLEVSRRSLARAPQPPGGRVPPVVEEGALRPSRNQVTRCWNATTAHRARLRQRAGLEVSRRSQARAPQPPGARVPPVVEEGALRPSRNPVTRGVRRSLRVRRHAGA